jgi:hypothetical protein
VLFWIEFIVIATLVATRDREHSRLRGVGVVVAVAISVTAPLILAPFAQAFTWLIAPAVVIGAGLVVWVTVRRRV